MSDDRRNKGPTTEGRDEQGRFTAGNPGRPKGARHKATLAAQEVLDGESDALTRKAVELALKGDTTPYDDAHRRHRRRNTEGRADARSSRHGVLQPG